mmetsp:Transcript_24654/g.71135  ORF Transcript_24654/g.71135 Transcript_24654/m.71135 type:complete len:220 (+) Transcript_24654:714-1373(+)
MCPYVCLWLWVWCRGEKIGALGFWVGGSYHVKLPAWHVHTHTRSWLNDTRLHRSREGAQSIDGRHVIDGCVQSVVRAWVDGMPTLARSCVPLCGEGVSQSDRCMNCMGGWTLSKSRTAVCMARLVCARAQRYFVRDDEWNRYQSLRDKGWARKRRGLASIRHRSPSSPATLPSEQIPQGQLLSVCVSTSAHPFPLRAARRSLCVLLPRCCSHHGSSAAD